MSLTSDMTLSEVLRIRRGASSLFDDIGIDYACGGGTTLKNAATSAGLTANELIALLRDVRSAEGPDWNERPLSELTRYLAHDHQRLLSGLLPRVRSAIDAAVECHGHLPLLNRMHDLCESLSALIAEHASSEERELFPIVEKLEAAASSPGLQPPQTRISARVLREYIEHENVRDRVHTLRDLAAELQLECEVDVLAMHLRAFQRHLNQHMHLENNVLYPRAIAIENSLRHPAPVY
jgi:regulator of cell morphogenesis and NO signaling